MTQSTEPLGEQAANAIYDVLVRECRATESSRAHFVHVETDQHVSEWRFIGALGFGGKFWRTSGYRPDGTWGEMWHVNNYPEDHTPERDAMCEAANAALWLVQSDDAGVVR